MRKRGRKLLSQIKDCGLNGCRRPAPSYCPPVYHCVRNKDTPERRCGSKCNANECPPGQVCTQQFILGYIQLDGKTCGPKKPRCFGAKPQCPIYRPPRCKRGQRITTKTLRNGCKKPVCVYGKPTIPAPGLMPMPVVGPQPCPKSVKMCPAGQKRVLKSGYGSLPKPRRVKQKGGRSSKFRRGRKILSEDGENALPPYAMREKCGPV